LASATNTPSGGAPNQAVRSFADSAAGPTVDREKESLKALFDTAALVPAHRPAAPSVKVANAVVHTALPRVAQEVIAQPSSAAGHFQAGPVQPILNHFSGKAVQSLNSVGFSATE